MQRLAFLVAILISSAAAADEYELSDADFQDHCVDTAINAFNERACTTLQPQVQADMGFGVLNIGYEEPIAKHWALQVEGGIAGVLFLPVFGLGDEAAGYGGGTRLTWFKKRTGHGPYIAQFLKVTKIDSADDDQIERTGVMITTGAIVGWSWRVTQRFEARLGIGAQYVYFEAPPAAGSAPPLTASTPYITYDAMLGYRL